MLLYLNLLRLKLLHSKDIVFVNSKYISTQMWKIVYTISQNHQFPEYTDELEEMLKKNSSP